MAKDSRHRRQIDRVVNGAVKDAINAHPEFFALGRARSARYSIVKRVAGAVEGWLEQLASPKGEAGVERRPIPPAADETEGVTNAAPPEQKGGGRARPPTATT